jgi:hypothetical protein
MRPGALLFVGLLPPAAIAPASCAVFGDFSLSTGPCAAGEVCFATPPNFFGPVIKLDGPAGCPEGWVVLPLGVEHLVGPIDPRCECDCGPAPPPDCSMSKIELCLDNACTMNCTSVFFPPTVKCEPGAFWGSAKVLPVVTPPAPTCGGAGAKRLGGRVTTEPVTLCTPSNAGASCAQGSTCTPSVPPSSAVCAYTQGDLPCPVGFATRAVFSRSYTDESTCDGSGCQCTVKDPASCTGSMFLATDATCKTISQVVGTSCTNLPASPKLQSSSSILVPNPATCVAGGAAIAKAHVVAADAYTLCCP